MKALSSRLALCLVAGFAALSVQAADTTATVNGKGIPASRLEVMLGEQRAQGAPDSPQLRDAVREELIRREVLAQEAAKLGLDKKADVQAQMDLARQAILIRAYLQDWVKKNPVSDADLKKQYDTIVAELGTTEYHPRHILVETEDAAKEIIAKLQGGAKFDELATSSSIDPGSKERGGDLGWVSPARFIKPFSDAMVKLKKGEYTAAPVQTDFGYHVILLEDTRTAQPPALDEVKGELQPRLQQDKVEKHIVDLRSKATVQ